VDQIAEIVGQAGEQADFGGHDILPDALPWGRADHGLRDMALTLIAQRNIPRAAQT
jgi:hypothetical protein